MSNDNIVFKSPHIQEALPDLVDLAKKAREVCNDRNLCFVIVVHDPAVPDRYVASNIPQEYALALLSYTVGSSGHGAPKKIR